MDFRDFKNIKKEYMPSVIWDWCGEPEAEEIDRFLELLPQKGFKRVIVHPRKQMSIPYLGKDYFELIRTAARRSAKYNTELWIYDEDSPYSGSAGGEVTSVPDYCGKEILNIDSADVKKSDTVIAQKGSQCAVVRLPKGAIKADICQREVGECFSQTVYDSYRHNCSRFMGEEICGFVSETSLSCDLPYSEYVYSAFQKENGKDAFSLFEDEDARKLYFSMLENAALHNFISIVHESCKNCGVLLSGSVFGSHLSRQKFYRLYDLPFAQLYTENPDFTQIKLLTSACKNNSVHIKAPSFSGGKSRMKGIALSAILGAKNICYDSLSYSFTDMEKYRLYKFHFCMEGEDILSDYVARISRLINETEERLCICLVFPISYFRALSSSEYEKYYEAFNSFTKKLLYSGADFQIIEDECLTDSLKQSYSEIIFPDLDNPESFTYPYSAELEFENCGEVLISKRYNENAIYYLVYFPCSSDARLVYRGKKSVFLLDAVSGELFNIPMHENGCDFSVKEGSFLIFAVGKNLYADDVSVQTGGALWRKVEEIGTLSFSLMESGENILPLKDINACFGKKSARNETTDSLCEKFHKLPDGELIKLKYPFEIDRSSVGDVSAVIENASNMDEILLNGKSLQLKKNGHGLYKCSITELLSDGKNTFSLEYRKSSKYLSEEAPSYRKPFYSFGAAGLEPIYLTGDFDVSGKKLIKCSPSPSDVTLGGMPYYYGFLTYTVKLPEISQSGMLLKIEGSFDTCKVKSGKREKLFFSSPVYFELFELDSDAISEITVSNTLHNLFCKRGEKLIPFGIQKISVCK